MRTRTITRSARTRRARCASVALGLSLTLAACGGDEMAGMDTGGAVSDAPSTPPQASAPSTSTGTGVAAEHNDADTAFINDMAPHHSGAIDMAELATTRAGSSKVKQLAARIAAAQGPEIQQMQQLASAWGVQLPADHQMAMEGEMAEMMEADMTALKPLSGTAFDREFLTRMTAHHQMALPMARAEVQNGLNPQAKTLAQKIIDDQTAEIAEMKTLLQSV